MHVVIIGATQGLGLELVRKFLLEGNMVAAGVVDRITPASLQDLGDQYGDSLMVFQADVTNEPEILRGASLCSDFFGGKADVLCNTAGVLLPGDRVNLLHQCDVAELRRTFEVNAIGPIIVAKCFVPLLKQGGRLFTVTSEGAGIKNCGTWVPAYVLSKAAATKACGMLNMAVPDIDFYAVHPGRMNTEMGRATAQTEPQESAEGIYRLMTGATPLDRERWYIDYMGREMDA